MISWYSQRCTIYKFLIGVNRVNLVVLSSTLVSAPVVHLSSKDLTWSLTTSRGSTYRPSEPLCNTTYHVRRTFWVFHRSGTLQVSDSLLSIDSAGGCSIPIKKLKWLHHFSEPWTTLHRCWKQVDNCHRLGVASHTHPMRARRAHSRSITDNCRGTSLTHCCFARVHSLRPLKRHCWYWPWHHLLLYCKHSSPLVTPLKRQHCLLCGGPLIFF